MLVQREVFSLRLKTRKQLSSLHQALGLEEALFPPNFLHASVVFGRASGSLHRENQLGY